VSEVVRELLGVLPSRLKPGDRVRIVLPASTPSEVGVEAVTKVLEDRGLRVEIGKHAT
jgi:muramoyltetrapeptide carboxypeptidase